MGGTPFLEIPVWIPQIIIPVTFALMTLRFSLRFFAGLARIFKSGNQIEHGNPS
jgi:TRAP-type C4-dicarboxylate transport system permease small subunit